VAEPPASRTLLRHVDFLKLWGGQSVSELGSQVTVLAMPLTAVIVLHATPFEVGALNAMLMAPFLLIGLPAGAIVDRLRMRRVLVVSDICRMLVLGSIPVVAAFGTLTMFQLYVVAFVAGALTVFFDVAYQSYLPVLIDRDQLVDGNAKLTSTSQIAGVAGPALGGALVSAVGAATAIAADASSYLLSVISLLAIRRADPVPAPTSGPVLSTLVGEVREGLRFVLRHPKLRYIAACTGIGNFATDVSFAVLTVYMVRVLHLSPARIGLLFAVGGVAGFLGAVTVGRIIKRIGVGWTTIGGAIGSSLGGLAIPLATPGWRAWWIAVGMAFFWLFATIYNVAQVSLRQALCPPRLLGRMNATMRFLVWGPMPIGALIGGALGASIGLRPTLWVAGAVGLIAPMSVTFSSIRHQREIPDIDHDEPDVIPEVEASPIGPLPEVTA
jgi:predicted MFS family arabinose efflux permease